MSNVFSAPRFGKYFKYDVRQAYNKYGISALVTALSPVIAFVFYQLFVLIIEGHFANKDEGMSISRAILAVFFVINIFIFAPVKLYGKITDKRFGSDYLLLPVSSFEKWLSMIIVSIIIVPVISFVMIAGVDSLMSLIFPFSYGESLFSFMTRLSEKIGIEMAPIDIFPMILIGTLSNILVYLLGAIIFKKNKIAKTILATFVIGLVLSLISALFFANSNFNFNISTDDVELAHRIMTVCYALVIAQFLILSAAVFYRLKTIQH